MRYVNSREETAALCSASANKGKKVVLYFTASWCGPCKRIKKPLEALAEEYSDALDVYAVDVDEVASVAELYRVRSMPTFVFCADGKVLAEFSGASESRLERYMRALAEGGEFDK